jgi:hypothetical protein
VGPALPGGAHEENIMAKGQKHGNKEAKKPKKVKVAVVAPQSTFLPPKPSGTSTGH